MKIYITVAYEVPDEGDQDPIMVGHMVGEELCESYGPLLIDGARIEVHSVSEGAP